MAEKKETAKTSVEVNEENATKYPVEELCENSIALFGKKREVVIGALHNAYKTASGSFTKKQVQDAIDKFLNKEVK